MKLSLVSEHASPLALLGSVDAGGQNVHVDQPARALGRLGDRVVVHTRRDDPGLPARVELGHGVVVEHVDAGPAHGRPGDVLLVLSTSGASRNPHRGGGRGARGAAARPRAYRPGAEPPRGALRRDPHRRRGGDRQRPGGPPRRTAGLLLALRAVDAVVVFEEATPAAVLERLRPDVWVKGGDYAGGHLPESEALARWGGRTVLVPYLSGRSTSTLLTHARTTHAHTARDRTAPDRGAPRAR